MIDTFDAVSNIDLFLRCSSSFKLSFGVLSPPKSNCIEEWPFSTQQPSHILMRQRKLREEKKNFNFLWQNRQKHFAELSEKLWKLRKNLKNKSENRLTAHFRWSCWQKLLRAFWKYCLIIDFYGPFLLLGLKSVRFSLHRHVPDLTNDYFNAIMMTVNDDVIPKKWGVCPHSFIMNIFRALAKLC